MAARSEHWFVLGGEGVVTLDGDSIDVRRGVPSMCRSAPLISTAHRIQTTGSVPLLFVEVRHG
ncbi:MAG: hypothetical protein ACTHKL_30175, partial [Streptosporangiaceae bacterium]